MLLKLTSKFFPILILLELELQIWIAEKYLTNQNKTCYKQILIIEYL